MCSSTREDALRDLLDETDEGRPQRADHTALLGDHVGACACDLVITDRQAAPREACADNEAPRVVVAACRPAAGGIRVDSYLPTRTVELVVHAHDIATAAQLPVEFPVPVLSEVLAVLARTGAERGHGLELLHALIGRGVLSDGFSVV